jgi:hypothetical protein
MNTEAVERLSESFRQYDKTELIASALLKELDGPIIQAMVTKYIQDRASPSVAKEYLQHLRATLEKLPGFTQQNAEEIMQALRQFAAEYKEEPSPTLSEALAKLASVTGKPGALSKLSKVLEAMEASGWSVTRSTTPTAPPVHDDEDSDDRPHPPPR